MHSQEILSSISLDFDNLFVTANGGWSDWSPLSECTPGNVHENCTDGVLYVRHRNCTNPPPYLGGDDCSGADVQTVHIGEYPAAEEKLPLQFYFYYIAYREVTKF